MSTPGSWTSPLTAAAVSRAGRAVRQVAYAPDGTPWWAETRPDERGRTVLCTGEGVQVPEGFDARTAFREYGGLCWVPLEGGGVVSVDARDQRLWRLVPGEPPRALTPDTAGRDRWCLPQVVAGGLLCLRERLDGPGRRVPNDEVVLLPDDGGEPVVLWEGSDFVDAPRLSPSGDRLAFLTWDHPRMPWDGTELRVAAWRDGALGPAEVVLGGATESVFQPEWEQGDPATLRVVTDRSGWWNLVRVAPGAEPVPVWPVRQECGVPAWTAGAATHATLTGGRVAVVHGTDTQRLSVLDPDGQVTELDLPFTSWAPVLAAHGDRVLGIAATGTSSAAVVEVDTADGTWQRLAGPPDPDQAFAPAPEVVEVPTVEGRRTWAVLFPPAHPREHATAPVPWVMVVHGGPTSASPVSYDARTAFWTSRGLGVVAVNHGGSTGHGRAYRELLRGRWGQVDVDDCEAVARWLQDTGRASAVVIRGGSAGGWSVLSALTRGGSVFAAGASYFGVADLRSMAATTHDFESRYMDALVPPDEQDARSPLAHLDRLDRPLLVLQGDEDHVVPVEQARMVVDRLEARAVPHAFLLFAGEGHGFRRADSQVASLEAELSFYGQVLGFPTPDVARLEVRHLEPAGAPKG